jgi:hypothetical protein
MGNVTLTEQLIAMQCVDDIRHAQMAVDEHLDVPARRTEVAKRIADYYVSQQVEVPVDVVESGVRTYFDRRLTFEAPRAPRLANWLASVYVTRGNWLRPLLTSSVVLAGIGGVGAFVYNDYESFANKRVAAGIEHFNVKTRHLDAELTRIQTNAGRIRTELAALGGVNATAILDPLDAEAATAAAALKGVGQPLVPVDRNNRDAIEARVVSARTELDTIEVSLGRADRLLSDASAVLGAKRQFDNLAGTDDFRRSGPMSSHLNTQAAIVKTEFLSLAPGKVDQVKKDVRALSDLTAAIPQLQTGRHDLERLERQFGRIGMDGNDRQKVLALLAKGQGAMQAMDAVALRETVKELEQLAEYATVPLQINVVDRAGMKSGVERNYNASGGKSWYLIVEALDPAGNVVAVPVRSSEKGGSVQYRPYFGVRVSHEQYELVKSEKKQTGHVSHKRMGEKLANALVIKYANTFSSEPETIMEW